MITPQRRGSLPLEKDETDRAWFRNMFQEYHTVMVSAAYNRLSNLTDAEEAAAEVFRIAWTKRDVLRDTERLAWLYTTLRNVVGNEYRRRARVKRREDRAKNDLLEETNLASGESDESERIEIRDAVAAMDSADRELIWMAYWEELTREEMAEVLGCSIASVRVRLFRARGKLKVLLNHLDMRRVGGVEIRD